MLGPSGQRDADPEPASDDVFKALADVSRRLLLDSLFTRDGQTLGELAARLPGMTRFGVMKHLKQLEAAGLVTTRKVGRQKLHYLNPVPIRLIHDRWISKYAAPWVGGMADLKASLESETWQTVEVYVRAAPEPVWQALTGPIGVDPHAAQVQWTIEAVTDAVCRVAVTRATSADNPAAAASAEWSKILSSLKSYLETGQPLDLAI
jgi:DNA-binding transcriptional ArsR family regulator